MMTAACPACTRDIRVNGDGSLRRHEADGQRCPGERGVWLVPLPWPRPLVTPNDRHHYQRKAALMAQMKSDARWAIRAAHLPAVERAEVGIHWRIPDRKVRDADSLQLALKAVTDALVAEGVLPDDGWACVPAAHMRIHPPQQGMPGTLWLTVTVAREVAA